MSNYAGLACPDCSGTVHLMADSRGVSCPAGHFFPDTMALLARNPRRLPIPQRVVRQDGERAMSVMIPGAIAEALEKRFPKNLNASLVSILSVLLDDGAFVVGGPDGQEISTKLGGGVTNSVILKGKVFNLQQELDVARAQVKSLQQSAMAAIRTGKYQRQDDDGVTIQLSESCMEKLRLRAEGSNISIAEAASAELENANTLGWF